MQHKPSATWRMTRINQDFSGQEQAAACYLGKFSSEVFWHQKWSFLNFSVTVCFSHQSWNASVLRLYSVGLVLLVIYSYWEQSTCFQTKTEHKITEFSLLRMIEKPKMDLTLFLIFLSCSRNSDWFHLIKTFLLFRTVWNLWVDRWCCSLFFLFPVMTLGELCAADLLRRSATPTKKNDLPWAQGWVDNDWIFHLMECRGCEEEMSPVYW